MGFLTSVLGIFGFAIGIPIGLIIGFFVLVYSKPKHQEYPPARPLVETSISVLLDLLPDIPLWMKNPDYERVDWFNRFLSYMWPYLDKAICRIIRSSTQPIFADYIGKFCIESIEFEKLSLGTLPPTVHGVKFYETNEKELLLEPSIKWAGNPNIVLVLKMMSLRIRVQVSKSDNGTQAMQSFTTLSSINTEVLSSFTFAASSADLPLFWNGCSFINGKGRYISHKSDSELI